LLQAPVIRYGDSQYYYGSGSLAFILLTVSTPIGPEKPSLSKGFFRSCYCPPRLSPKGKTLIYPSNEQWSQVRLDALFAKYKR